MGRIIFIAVLAVLAYLIFKRSPRGYDPNDRGVVLLHLCRGDAVRMERLIADQQLRTRGISRNAAIDQAIEAFRRDEVGGSWDG